MDIRHNDVFYRAINRRGNLTPVSFNNNFHSDINEEVPSSASGKILLASYKQLIQNFNHLDKQTQKSWQLEVNIVARQLAQLLKQAAKNKTVNGYPSLSLLQEIRALDKRITADIIATA